MARERPASGARRAALLGALIAATWLARASPGSATAPGSRLELQPAHGGGRAEEANQDTRHQGRLSVQARTSSSTISPNLVGHDRLRWRHKQGECNSLSQSRRARVQIEPSKQTNRGHQANAVYMCKCGCVCVCSALIFSPRAKSAQIWSRLLFTQLGKQASKQRGTTTQISRLCESAARAGRVFLAQAANWRPAQHTHTRLSSLKNAEGLWGQRRAGALGMRIGRGAPLARVCLPARARPNLI